MQSFSTITGVIRMRNEGCSFPECMERFQIGSSTVQYIMKKYSYLGNDLDELIKMTPSEVEELFYPSENSRHRKIEQPDFDKILHTLESSGTDFKKLDVWEEYHRLCPNGYRRSWFLELYNDYCLKRYGPEKVSMGVNRVPGERLYIDYCGDTALIHITDLCSDPSDPTEQQKIILYLTSMGYSSKLYGEATLDTKQIQFNSETAHAIEYYGAIPKYLVPDNLKDAVTRNTYDEVVINASFQDLEAFYDTIVLPPPYRKPRGKATVERYVKDIQHRIILKLQQTYYFRNLEEVNEMVMAIIEEENDKIPRGYKMSHNELFELYDKPAMKPLKDVGFTDCEYAYCRGLTDNYHVHYDSHFYSVPYRFINTPIVIKATREKIILCDTNNRQLAEHKRCYIPTIRYVTEKSHMPANHQFYEEVNHQDSDYYLNWANKIGPNMKQMIFMILKSANHDEQMYSACNSILHMCDSVPKGICEEAAADCIRRNKCRHSEFRVSLSDILRQRKLSSITARLPDIDNVRGKGYYK